jgi:hypothetical protein
MLENDTNISKNNPIDIVFKNKNLFKICFDFCDIEDILYLSLVSKNFHKMTEKFFDYKFEKEIEKSYFSNYSHYE